MQDLILYIVKNLVTKPEAVTVDEQRDGGEVNLVLSVDPADMGMVIGKSGNTIKAIRKLLIVKAMADNVRVNLQLNEPEGYVKPERSEKSEVSDSVEPENQQTSGSENPDSTEATDQTDTPISSDLSEKSQAE